MQLHTHAVVLNLAERADRTCGALDGRHLFRWKMAAGAVYRASLAAGLERELGVTIERTDDEGLFEITGVPKTVLDHFSSRRRDILGKLEELGLAPSDSQAIKASVTKSSRCSKEAVFEGREEQLVRWSQEVEALGFDQEKALGCLHRPQVGHDRAVLFRKDLDGLLDKLTRSESVFREKDLVAGVAAAATGRGEVAEDIVAAVEHLKLST